ncbi:hypothetical protein [Amycolatopsis palatopharyngis]|uniref:hypothetical protein n=1 Tax=Amycolatopsis palatopharyngis TaxID=187982 RepID=UPI0013BE9DAF|nr:hypothetical protein [Amycolatopsis palatopharyngis]
MLLVLFGAGGTPAGASVDEYTGQQRITTVVELASLTPPIHDDGQDQPRLSDMARYAPATVLPDTCWAVCHRVNDERSLRRFSCVGEARWVAMAAAAPTGQSSRAPPSA